MKTVLYYVVYWSTPFANGEYPEFVTKDKASADKFVEKRNAEILDYEVSSGFNDKNEPKYSSVQCLEVEVSKTTDYLIEEGGGKFFITKDHDMTNVTISAYSLPAQLDVVME